MPEKKFDLEDRLVEFVGRIIEVVEALPKSRGNGKVLLHRRKILTNNYLEY